MTDCTKLIQGTLILIAVAILGYATLHTKRSQELPSQHQEPSPVLPASPASDAGTSRVAYLPNLCMPDGATLVPGEPKIYSNEQSSIYYLKDGAVFYSVCSGYDEGLNMDAATFTFVSKGPMCGPGADHPCGPNYVKDYRIVSVEDQVLVDADPTTFTVLDAVGVARDHAHFFLGTHTVSGWLPADVRTKWAAEYAPNPRYFFEYVKPGVRYGAKLFASLDGIPVTLNTSDGTVEQLTSTAAIDLPSFLILEGPYERALYAKDKNSAYCWKTSGDEQKGYTSTFSVVAGADPKTFVIDHGEDYTAHDNSHRYYGCELVK